VAHLPNARLYAFERKGHLPIFTATTEFCNVVEVFRSTVARMRPAPCMDDHKLGLDQQRAQNLRGWWGEDNCAMSVQGPKRKSCRAFLISVLPSTADIRRRDGHVRRVPGHKVAALQPAARGQEPRGRKPAERTALAGLRAPS